MQKKMPTHRYFLTDFVTIQRQSFFHLLEKGLIEEFSKRNPITNTQKDLEFIFYPEYYILTRPEYTPQEAIIKNKSYTSKLFVPGQLTDFKSQKAVFKWFYIGNIPLMTKRGHFILNGAARVIVNQILRSPGIYYQQKIYENYQEKWSQKPDDTYKRFYADLICMRGTWLRIEMDKEKNIWAQMKKGPKIPIYWFLLAMGLSEKKIFKTITDSYKLLGNLKNSNKLDQLDKVDLFDDNEITNDQLDSSAPDEVKQKSDEILSVDKKKKKTRLRSPKQSNQHKKYAYLKNPPEAWVEIYKLLSLNTIKKTKQAQEIEDDSVESMKKKDKKAIPVAKKMVGSLKDTKKLETFLPSVASLKLEHENNLANKNLNEFEANVISGIAGTLEQKKKDNKSPLKKINLAEEGRKWLYNKFMNPRSYNLSKQGRLAFNKKLALNISTNQTTLTGLDVLYATDYLIKVEKGIFKTDDIDHLKNRRVRTSGELIQIQIGVGLVRLEKSIRENLNKLEINNNYYDNNSNLISLLRDPSVASYLKPTYTNFKGIDSKNIKKTDFNLNTTNLSNSNSIQLKNLKLKSNSLFQNTINSPFYSPFQYSLSTLISIGFSQTKGENLGYFTDTSKNPSSPLEENRPLLGLPEKIEHKEIKTLNNLNKSGLVFPTKIINKNNNIAFQNKKENNKENKTDSILVNFVNSKAFNSAIREFFGTSPLSQFMDQINPLAELTHKRRLSSMGPGGVTRDTATLAIRGIHPTHYGRICPIETPEGKNTGLVNSMTTYARVNANGIIESPFYRVYKGQVQKKTGMYFFSAEQEEQIKLAAADLSTSSIGFLPKSFIPVRIAEDFTKIPRTQVQYVGVSPLQMISVATSLIPFLEHDDANRALMGSNMQRQAVPLIKPERPIVGTGLEARTISDSGHAIIAKYSGFVTYVSSKKIVVYSYNI